MDTQKAQDMAEDPQRIINELKEFRKTAQLLSSREISDHYRGEWVALYARNVCAHGETLETVLDQVDAQGLPREHTLIHFIEDESRVMILHAHR